MSKYLVLHDRRLLGGIPHRPQLGILHTDGSTPLSSTFRTIRAEARHGKIHTLFVLCHGFAGVNKLENLSMDAGGMGLQLGKENVRHGNVSLWRAIHGKVTNVVIMACAAADTQPRAAGTTSDGRYLMGALALHTQAAVYAATLIQYYFRHRNLRNGKFDFQGWEGQLLRFPPDGTMPRAVNRAPKELSDFLGHVAS